MSHYLLLLPHTQSLSDFVQENEPRVVDYAEVKCASPLEVAGQELSSVDYGECSADVTTTPEVTPTPLTSPATPPPVTETTTKATSDNSGGSGGGDDDLALIISLPIVGAVVLFLLMSWCVYRESKRRRSKLEFRVFRLLSHVLAIKTVQ